MAVGPELEHASPRNRAGSCEIYSDSSFYHAYEPKEVLGRGLASVVRKCVERASKKEYAVKIVDVSTERQSEKEAKRLNEETLSEIKLLKMLAGHPSIITLHAFYPTPTFLFSIFEVAQGELFDQLNRAVSFSEKKTRSVMRQLFHGVVFLHEKLVVHRDLKLENILCIDAHRRVVIGDFGFAKQLEPGQKLRDLFGTPGYLAPETLRCQMYEDADGYGLEVDNWALGVILYTCLAGYAPFYHRQQLRMMRMIQEGRYDFSQEEWENVSEGAKDLIRRLLTVDVSRRITSRECLDHPWIRMGAAMIMEPVVKKNLAKKFRIAQISIRFLIRLKNLKHLKLRFRHEHETESAWVNRGFYFTQDMLFMNRPKPTRYVSLGETSSSTVDKEGSDSGVSSNESTK